MYNHIHLSYIDRGVTDLTVLSITTDVAMQAQRQQQLATSTRSMETELAAYIEPV